MTDELMLAMFCLVPIVLIAFASTLTRKVDKDRDWIAERHRKISRNGFKSRMGVR